MSKFKNHVPIKQQIIYQQAESAAVPQPSLRELIEYYSTRINSTDVVYDDELEQQILALLATTKLEKRPVQEEFLHSPRIDIAYNQGAEAQYAAIVRALGGEE